MDATTKQEFTGHILTFIGRIPVPDLNWVVVFEKTLATIQPAIKQLLVIGWSLILWQQVKQVAKHYTLNQAEENLKAAITLLSSGKETDHDKMRKTLLKVIGGLEHMLDHSHLPKAQLRHLGILATQAHRLKDIAWSPRQSASRNLMAQETKFVQIDSNLLRRLAIELAAISDFVLARRYAFEALSICKQYGLINDESLAYSALAQIEILAGNYLDAQQYAQEALNRSEQLSFRYGQGMAQLAQAISHRLHSERPDFTDKQRLELLETALTAAKAAASIFLSGSNKEQLISSYYERGLIHQELGRVFDELKKKASYFCQAEYDLIRARRLALRGKLWLKWLEVSLGLAWTYYYSHQGGKLTSLLMELQQGIEVHFNDYQINGNHLPEIKEDMSMDTLTQLGRWYVLRGVLSIDEVEKSGYQFNQGKLVEAAHHFTIALEYNGLVGQVSQGFQGAANAIYNRIKKLNTSEQKAFYEAIAKEVEQLQLIKEKCYLWRELGNVFGPYELVQYLA